MVKAAIFSFFTGAGFLDLGFENSGFNVVYVNEIYQPFIDAYIFSRKKLGIPEAPFGCSAESIADLIKPKGQRRLGNLVNGVRDSKSLVGFIGGPPCPDFSVGGKNRGQHGENGVLSATYAKLIIQQQPDFFLFENVKGLWNTRKHRQFYEELKKKIQRSGYHTTERLINAIEYGAPQDRNRIILLGFKKHLVGQGVEKFSEGGELPENVFPWEAEILHSKAETFKKPWPDQTKFKKDSDLKLPEGIPEELTIEYWFRKNDVLKHPNGKHHFLPRAALPRFESIPEGDVSRKSFKRLHRWRYSPTAAYGNNEVHIHPYKARRISAAEAMAIQSLPKNFILPDNMTLSDMFKAIGNGVPYLAAKGIAKTIRGFLQNNIAI